MALKRVMRIDIYKRKQWKIGLLRKLWQKISLRILHALTQILQRKWIKIMKKLMLLDGNSLVYPAFHALSEADMRNSNGHPTGAIYGFQ